MVDWDKRYREATEPPFGTQPSEYLRQILARSDFTVSSALCLADGDGRNGRWLAAQGISVTAVDLSGIATAQARIADGLSGNAVERIAADLSDWQPDNSRVWDAGVIIALHCERTVRESLVRNAAHWIAPGGWFVLEGFSTAGLTEEVMGPKDADKLWDLDVSVSWLDGFQIVEAFDGIAALDEGPRHQGPARIVRLLARRQANP